ncbi:hypothetical protein EYC80_007629 [Monilinia laxa]|uniref:Uncharacterized protein n=1 Tax=Monilinia laxa TaxID=61186 RepID=A0A5N6JWR2_MONLA|nr:hypothetical protein EYC80_007629 [Monilinia laxa]
MRCDAMRCDAMRCDAMRCDAMRCDAMRCDDISAGFEVTGNAVLIGALGVTYMKGTSGEWLAIVEFNQLKVMQKYTYRTPNSLFTQTQQSGHNHSISPRADPDFFGSVSFTMMHVPFHSIPSIHASPHLPIHPFYNKIICAQTPCIHIPVHPIPFLCKRIDHFSNQISS